MATNPFATGTAAPQASGSTFAPAGANGSAASTADAPDLNNGAQALLDPPLDLNDPGLTSESLTVKEGDAFAEPPPPPKGKYRCRLSLRGVTSKDLGGQSVAQYSGGADASPWVPERDIDKKTGMVRGAFAKTLMDITIIDAQGKFDGLHIYVRYKWMDTRLNRDGVSKVMTVLNLLKQPDGKPWVTKGERLGHRELIERFVKALKSEPEIVVEADWEVSCRQCGEEAQAKGKFSDAIIGMHKFPASKTVRGEHDPELPCAANRAHGYSKARLVAVGFEAVK